MVSLLGYQYSCTGIRFIQCSSNNLKILQDKSEILGCYSLHLTDKHNYWAYPSCRILQNRTMLVRLLEGRKIDWQSFVTARHAS
jgi:hypothetical protein